nr:71_t:CDS:2 [Entrophospora candida]
MMCKNKNTGPYAVENCKENEKEHKYKEVNKSELSGEYSLDDIKINITENGTMPW